MRRPKGTNSTIEKQIATHVEKYTIDIAGRMPRIEFPDSIGLCQCLREYGLLVSLKTLAEPVPPACWRSRVTLALPNTVREKNFPNSHCAKLGSLLTMRSWQGKRPEVSNQILTN